MKIPTYSADGKRLYDRTRASIERLEALSHVIVERRKNKPVCAIFRPLGGATPVRKTAHLGQAYSYRQALPSGRHVWRFSQLLDRTAVNRFFCGDVKEQDADLFIRAVFRAVPLSVLRRDPATPAKSKAQIIPIEGRRPRRRPVEFDSEMRAA